MSDSPPTIRAVLFDFGGVLAEEGFRAGLHTIARIHNVDPEAVYQHGVDTVYASGYVTGGATEADFWNAMRERFPLGENDEALTEIILDRFTLRPEMLGAVRDLRGRGLVCAILSDQTDWLERLDQRDAFFQEFDHVYTSFRLGRSKRDAGTFDTVVADLGLAPGEVLFLDDDPGNTARARSRGLNVLGCEVATRCLDGLDKLLGSGVQLRV